MTSSRKNYQSSKTTMMLIQLNVKSSKTKPTKFDNRNQEKPGFWKGSQRRNPVEKPAEPLQKPAEPLQKPRLIHFFDGFDDHKVVRQQKIVTRLSVSDWT